MNRMVDKSSELSRSGVSRYIQLATLYRRRIQSGQWPVSKQIPTVDELAAESGVARATIRQALGLLEAEGLVSRFRAKGTFVNRPTQDQIWCEVETDWSGLLRSREGATIEVLSMETVEVPTYVPHPLGDLAPAYRHLRRRHSHSGSPFLLADVFIDEQLCKKLSPEDFTAKTAFKLVAGLPGVDIVDARQTLTMGSADFGTARELNIPLNAPIAEVNRSALSSKGRLILIANGIYRGDVIRVDMKLR